MITSEQAAQIITDRFSPGWDHGGTFAILDVTDAGDTWAVLFGNAETDDPLLTLGDQPPYHVDKTTGTIKETAMTITAAAPDAAPPAEEFAPWHGVLAPEGVTTGDAREFADGALTWRDLPLPLRWQKEDDIGHDGAVVVGRIDSIERVGNELRATGVWDNGEEAQEARRLLVNQMLRGVSVDLDDVTMELVDADTHEPIEGDMLDILFGEPTDAMPISLVTAGRISAATLCPIPAFQEAFVVDGVEGQETMAVGGPPGEGGAPVPTGGGMMPDGETPCSCDETADDFDPECECEPEEEEVEAALLPLVASATSPVYAATEFTDPGLTGPTPLTVTDDGRVFGHLAVWGTCHIGFDGVCVTPPTSPTSYAYFATGEVQTDGGPVPVGQITLGTGHAAARLGHRPAVAHYDDTGLAAADVAAGEDEYGIWVAGRMRPGTTDEQVTALRHGGALSGDWRRIGGALELVAALAVNVPGFPIPRVQVAASAGHQTSLVASGVVATARAQTFTMEDVTREVMGRLRRRDRALALAQRLGRDRHSRMLAASALIGKD